MTKFLSYHGNDSDIRNITITYTLWVGTNVTENYTIVLVAPRNSSFYTVMQTAMEMDPKFAFEASEWPNGHYVHTLAGYKEEPMGYHYWLLYRLPEVPDPAVPPANHMVAPVGESVTCSRVLVIVSVVDLRKGSRIVLGLNRCNSSKSEEIV